MINRDCEEYKNWLAFLPGKMKTKGRLEDYNNPEHRCCLGHCCAANTSKVNRILKNGIVYYKSLNESNCLYISRDIVLPAFLQKILNITKEGRLTFDGQTRANDWLKQNNILRRCSEFTALSVVNDYSEATSEQIGELIAYLAKIEKDEGIEMFKPLSFIEASL